MQFQPEGIAKVKVWFRNTFWTRMFRVITSWTPQNPRDALRRRKRLNQTAASESRIFRLYFSEVDQRELDSHSACQKRLKILFWTKSSVFCGFPSNARCFQSPQTHTLTHTHTPSVHSSSSSASVQFSRDEDKSSFDSAATILWQRLQTRRELLHSKRGETNRRLLPARFRSLQPSP